MAADRSAVVTTAAALAPNAVVTMVVQPAVQLVVHRRVVRLRLLSAVATLAVQRKLRPAVATVAVLTYRHQLSSRSQCRQLQ